MQRTDYVFNLERVKKAYDGKEVLKGITLSFLPGAKIGVIGHNGAGKSTLMRIIAGEETDFDGEARPAPGITVGYVSQEPKLDPEKDVRGNIEDGLSGIRGLLAKYEDLSAKLGEDLGDDEMQKVLDRMNAVQEEIDAADGWEIDLKVEIAMEALRTPHGDATVDTLSGGEKRRVALARMLLSQPDILCWTSPPITSTPSRWRGWKTTCATTPARSSW